MLCVVSTFLALQEPPWPASTTQNLAIMNTHTHSLGHVRDKPWPDASESLHQITTRALPIEELLDMRRKDHTAFKVAESC